MKQVVIMRGLPGSGKSTLASTMIASAILGNGTRLVASYSTDDYFVHDGKYKFDGRKINKAHNWNQSRFRRALDNDYEFVIVDNTHTQFWEMLAYITYAIEKGYEVHIKEPNTSWRYDIDKLLVRNTHGVPRDSIQRMLNRWDSTTDVLIDAEQKFGVRVDLERGIIYATK